MLHVVINRMTITQILIYTSLFASRNFYCEIHACIALSQLLSISYNNRIVVKYVVLIVYMIFLSIMYTYSFDLD